MHDHHHTTIVATYDHDRLQAMMCSMIGARTPLAGLLRRKLSSAVVMLPADLDADVVTSGRRVRFKVDGYKSMERTLTWDPQIRGSVGSLSLQLPRGLSLLGLSVGQSMSYLTDARRNEFVEIEHVFTDEDEVAELDGTESASSALDGPRVVTTDRPPAPATLDELLMA